MKYWHLPISLLLSIYCGYSQVNISHAEKRDANMAYNVAVQSLKTGNFKSALESLNDAIDINGKFEKAYIERAKVKAQLGDLEGALQDVNNVIRTNEYIGEAYFVRAFIALKIDYNKVDLYDFELALNNGYKYAEVYYYEGLYNMLRKKHELALESFALAIQKNGKYIKAYENRATIKRMNGDIQGAIYDYEQVITIDSTKHAVLNLLGNSYKMLGNIDGAIDAYSKALDYDNNKEYYNNRGRAYFFIGAFEKSKADFAKAKDLDGLDLNIQCNLANVLVKMGKMEEALKMYDQIIDKDQKFGLAYLNRGLTRETQGNLKGACDDWTLAESYGQKKATEFLSECKKSK